MGGDGRWEQQLWRGMVTETSFLPLHLHLTRLMLQPQADRTHRKTNVSLEFWKLGGGLGSLEWVWTELGDTEWQLAGLLEGWLGSGLGRLAIR